MENKELQLAERYVLLTGESLFLTGKAGTGKTTFLHTICQQTHKRHIVLAPTGVAAVNAGGVTIHSFFQLPFDPYLPDVPELLTEYQMPQRKGLNRNKLNIIRTLELLIIDEISMVRADLLDAIDYCLRRYRHSSRPFGGVQLLLIGDVHQLSPVISEKERPYIKRVYPSPYFFCSKALQRISLLTIELTHVYRQQDPLFVDLLNHVRQGRMNSHVLQQLNSRVDTPPQGAITLTTHNRQADSINQQHYAALRGKEQTFEAKITGHFPESMMPAEATLHIKVGERVMFLKNDSFIEHRYFNGKLATVSKHIDNNTVEVTDDDGDTLTVGYEKWDNLRYQIASNGEIEQIVEGSFSQLPLRPAWAVTIHKAQGLTFDQVAINAAEAFAFGQVYVALSRCRTLQGLTLTAPLSQNVVFDDQNVSHFVESQSPLQEAEQMLAGCEENYYTEQILDLFGMSDVLHDAEQMNNTYAQYLGKLYPKQAEAMRTLIQHLVELEAVAEKFQAQLGRLPREKHAERAAKAADYYLKQLQPAYQSLTALLDVDIDNKAHRKVIDELGGLLEERLRCKIACLRAVQDKGLDLQNIGRAKAEAMLGIRKAASTHNTKSTTSQTTDQQSANEEVVERLKQWRLNLAREKKVPAFTILLQKTLQNIALALPSNEAALLEVSGVGRKTVNNYGQEILAIVAEATKRDHPTQ